VTDGFHLQYIALASIFSQNVLKLYQKIYYIKIYTSIKIQILSKA